MKFFRLLACMLLALAAVAVASAADEDNPPTRELKALAERQRVLLARAAKATVQAELEDVRQPLQTLVFDYENYVRKYPDVAAGYVSYAMLLGNPLLDERRKAAALLLKANQLDPDQALVKNQLGNYLAEEGRPIEAINYYLSAAKLEPNEPLYHFQIGRLLSTARDDFLKSGEWTRETLDRAMMDAFSQASLLAPDSVPIAYRYAEAYYDLEKPDWDQALVRWRALEARLSAPLEVQTVRLHIANVLFKQGQVAEARTLLDTVQEPNLQAQKQKLVAQLAGAGDK